MGMATVSRLDTTIYINDRKDTDEGSRCFGIVNVLTNRDDSVRRKPDLAPGEVSICMEPGPLAANVVCVLEALGHTVTNRWPDEHALAVWHVGLIVRRARLDGRQAQIAWLSACGETQADISKKLSLSAPTVSYALSSAHLKMTSDEFEMFGDLADVLGESLDMSEGI